MAVALALGITGLYAQVEDPADRVTVEVQNELAVNTAGLEFSPTFYEDGIVFISTNTAGLKKITDTNLKLSAMSILRSRRNSDGNLLPPEPFAAELSSIYHEGPVCFDRTAETVYFSRNDQKTRKDGRQFMRMYSATRSGSGWSEPKLMSFSTGDHDDVHPVISIDGDKLFFASNRQGGQGGMDLYVSYRVGDSWSEPVNLGFGVNTSKNEAFPFIHADNTLYFASDGQPGGKGGFDLYYVIPEGSQWTKPVNMGDPFNTTGDDFGLIVDLNKINGYFASNGRGGTGGDDIFNFHTENGNLDDYLLQNNRVPDRNLDLRLLVTDKKTAAPIGDAEIQILGSDIAQVIGRDEFGKMIAVQQVEGQDVIRSVPPEKGISGATNAKGRFATEIKPGSYTISVVKKGYQTKQLRVPISKPHNDIEIALEKVSYPGKVEWNASVFNYTTNAPLSGATLVLTDPSGRKDTIMADANGLVSYYLDPNKTYKVDMYQGGRIVGSTEVNTHGWGQITNQSLSVAPLLPGSVIELPNIYYNFNDATLRPDARKDLDLVVSLLRQHPNISVELASHTDSRGNERYNQELSQRRANGVVDYLVSQGIDRSRLKPTGYGESELRNRCTDGVSCTEQEHARNRRTEVRILTGIQGASVVYLDGQLPDTGASDPKPVTGASGAAQTGKKNTGKKQQTSANPQAGGSGGDFHVVAGSFLMQNRAQSQLEVLHSSGYSNAYITQYPNSPYFSIVAGEFQSREEAARFKRQLDSARIDAFVRVVK